jgi:hypothetical protein
LRDLHDENRAVWRSRVHQPRGGKQWRDPRNMDDDDHVKDGKYRVVVHNEPDRRGIRHRRESGRRRCLVWTHKCFGPVE